MIKNKKMNLEEEIKELVDIYHSCNHFDGFDQVMCKMQFDIIQRYNLDRRDFYARYNKELISYNENMGDC